MTAELPGWSRREFAAAGFGYPVYRRGAGPGVIVLPEVPGITPNVVRFAEEVVAAGFTVDLPHLFGRLGTDGTKPSGAVLLARLCVSRAFTTWATGQTSPVALWLRALARELHAELGGVGVGAVGMCFTGGFALAMMVDAPVVAPVLAQPALPFAVGPARSADLNLSPADRRQVQRTVAAGCPVLGLRYRADRSVGTRFDTLRTLLGENFTAVELAGRGHATLTAERHPEAVDRVLSFLADRLHR